MNHRPIVLLSLFKSGTHMMRRMVTEITGLRFFEPPIVRGRVDYRDPNQLILERGRYYSWHLVPGPEVRSQLVQAEARPILVLRNVCDLVVSMYHHFAGNIDADIGRGRNVGRYFGEMTRSDGLLAIILGMQRQDFRWPGLEFHLEHIHAMLELAALHPSHLTTFERFTCDRRGEAARVASFLGLSLSPAALDAAASSTSFQAMRRAAQARGRGSHYRRGVAGSASDELEEVHFSAIRALVARHAVHLPSRCEAAGVAEVLSGVA
ncbi:MAG: sulfotransferase domain-containing protein [Nannocystaceae bacterium]